MLEMHTLHPQKVNAWSGILSDRIIEKDRELPENVWFQQDGITSHYAVNVKNFPK